MNMDEEKPNSDTQQTQTETEQTTETLINQEQKEPEQKPEEKVEEKTEEKVPEVIPVSAEALVIPDGLTVPDDIKNEFIEILNGDSSPSDRANALIALQAKVMGQAQEADSTAWTKTQEEWQTEVKADPEIGGANLQPALTNIAKLVDEYGSKELRDVFDLTGAGNNVHVIKFLSKIAGKLTEGGHAGGRPGAVTEGDDAKAARMFPSMKG